jgi:peptide/nickel transport system substrate-binding protein
MIEKAMSEDLDSSYESWSQVPQLANNDTPWLWVGSIDYVFFVSDDVDFSENTHTIYPHGGDVWGNVYDWKPI